jgi:hypothetical protein
MYMCPIPNRFRDRVISLYSSKIVDKNIYYVLFLISVFIAQVVNLVQITFSKTPPSTSMHTATRVRKRRVARLYSIQYSEIALSQKLRSRTHVDIHIFA